MSPPVIETERLRLRGHEASDFAATAAMWSDKDVVRHLGGRASTPDEAWARLLRYAGHWKLLGFGYWLVEDKASGAFIGEVGLLDGKRDLTPSFGDTPEIGWALVAAAHGKGYAQEAVRAVLAWADERYGRTVCMISPDNAPSLKLAMLLGYREYARAAFKGEPMVLLEREV